MKTNSVLARYGTVVDKLQLTDTCWKYNTAERKQSRRFLECV